MAIGVFDSGAGGLSVVAAIRAAMPEEEIVYFADSAFVPYGSRSDREILDRTRLCCARLLEHDVRALVIACNTATANAIDAVRAWAPVPVIGVEPGLKPGASATRSGVVGVLATAATLASRRYAELLRRTGEEAPEVRFVAHAAQGWVELVESGQTDTPAAHETIRASVAPLLEAGADTLVLGCTHYPFLRSAIEASAPGVTIIETGPAIARELARRLRTATSGSDHAANAAAPPARLRLESSGDVDRLAALAARLLPDAA